MIRGQDLPAITQIADSDVLIVDSVSSGTRKITYAQLCQAVKQTLGIREVIDSVNITQDGYLMGGKVIADEFAKLNNELNGYTIKMGSVGGILLPAATDADGPGIYQNSVTLEGFTEAPAVTLTVRTTANRIPYISAGIYSLSSSRVTYVISNTHSGQFSGVVLHWIAIGK